jgi:hypothetical protein
MTITNLNNLNRQRLLRRKPSTTMAGDPYDKQQQQEERRRHRRAHKPRYEHIKLGTTTAEPAKRYYNAKGAKVDGTIKVAKHPPDPPRRQSIRLK